MSARHLLARSAVAGALLAALHSASAVPPSASLAKAARSLPWGVSEHQFAATDGKAVAVRSVGFSPEAAVLELKLLRFEGAGGDASLRDFAQQLSSQGVTKTQPWVLLNGGLSSYRTDVPLGLTVINGKVYSNLSQEKARTGRGGGLRWSGILCQPHGTTDWRILPAAEYRAGQCRSALQSGPTLVQAGGRVAIGDDEPKTSEAYTRSAVCVRADRQVRLVVTTGSTHLLPFARWLAAKEPAGLGCDTALNLSGDSSSGLVVKGSAGNPLVHGAATFPIPTALLLRLP